MRYVGTVVIVLAPLLQVESSFAAADKLPSETRAEKAFQTSRQIRGLATSWGATHSFLRDRSLQTPEVRQAMAIITRHLKAQKSVSGHNALFVANGRLAITTRGNVHSVFYSTTFGDALLHKVTPKTVTAHELDSGSVVSEILKAAETANAGGHLETGKLRLMPSNMFDDEAR
jgi:hypothetical protein